ncbi:MAG: CYTH domain-containing protein [Lysinibacillus sp.]
MSQQIEIEFKNMLTKEEYEQLLMHFDIDYNTIALQENHYFDTRDFALKKRLSGLRIRIAGTKIECTIKERSGDHAHLETTDNLTIEQAQSMLSGGPFVASEVLKRLQALEISPANLSVFGSLSTKRVELEFKGGLLVLDHSFYLNQDDYEVEYETTNERVGQQIFLQFLAEHGIAIRPADKKIARFSKALQQQLEKE